MRMELRCVRFALWPRVTADQPLAGLAGGTAMATILEFRAACGRTRTAGERASGTEAEIVMFPGVRVEYWRDLERPKEPETPTTAAAPKARKRRAKKTQS